jgi:hypothetical protein
VVVLDVVVGASVVVVDEVLELVLGNGVLATDVVAQALRRIAPEANRTAWPRTRMMVANPNQDGPGHPVISP